MMEVATHPAHIPETQVMGNGWHGYPCAPSPLRGALPNTQDTRKNRVQAGSDGTHEDDRANGS
jgi:hypothetical protein